MKTGWLVNDTLTCIPGTKTIWHDLLENIDGLEDKTFGHTDFYLLADKIILEATLKGKPDYIIRNATYFGPIQMPVKTISLLQDVMNYEGQIYVCNASTVVVYNTPYTAALYKYKIFAPSVVIPLGIDFDFFKPTQSYAEELGILPNSILFVGENNVYPKGFDKVKNLIDNSNYNFCLVMKNDFVTDHPRVKVFNKVDQETMLKIYNSCKMLLCASVVETQHLSGLEAAACNIPLVVTNVGVYFDLVNGEWGRKVLDDDFASNIQFVFDNYDSFKPREFFLQKGYDKLTCINKWKELVNSL
jgi:glycosyltransferase involved in cell wall biosynthesis